MPTVDHSTTVTGRLLDNLKEAGIGPSDINPVVITHAHPGHVGGTLGEAGDRGLPSARYCVSRGEWEFWTS